MSTLNEIAANHARMANALKQESKELYHHKTQVVGGFELESSERQPHILLQLITGVPDTQVVLSAGCSL